MLSFSAYTEPDLNVCYVNREFHIKMQTSVVKGLTNTWLNLMSSNTDLYVAIIILLLFIVIYSIYSNTIMTV